MMVGLAALWIAAWTLLKPELASSDSSTKPDMEHVTHIRITDQQGSIELTKKDDYWVVGGTNPYPVDLLKRNHL